MVLSLKKNWITNGFKLEKKFGLQMVLSLEKKLDYKWF